MKRLLIIGSILLVTAVAVLEIYVRSEAFSERIRPLVVERVAALFGADVQIGGVHANFIPLYLDVRDITLNDARGARLAGISKVRIYLNPFPLLIKKISIPEIVIMDPDIAIERSERGDANYSAFVDKVRTMIAEGRTGGKPGADIRLRTLSVKHGRISFADKATASRFAVSDLSMQVTMDLSGRNIRITVKSDTVRIPVPSYPEFVGRLRADASYRGGRFQIESLELSSTDMKLFASGALGAFPDGDIHMRLKWWVGPQAMKGFIKKMYPFKGEPGPSAEADAVITGTFADPSVKGGLSLKGLSMHNLHLNRAAVSFAYRNKILDINGRDWIIAKGSKHLVVENITSSLVYRDKGLDLHRFDVSAGDMDVHLIGRMNPSTGFDIVLAAGSSGAGRTISFFTSVPLEGKISMRGGITGPFVSPRFEGALSALPLTVRGVQFDAVRGTLTYRDKKITLSAGDIQRQTSHYMFDATADFSPPEPVYTARLNVIRSDVTSIVSLFYAPLPLKLSATGELSFSGTTRNFSAGGHLALDKGSAYGESFDRGTISASLTPRRVTFPQIALYKGSGVVKASGWIGFDKTYSAELEAGGLDLSEIKHVSGLSPGGQFTLEMASSGSFSNLVLKASLVVPGLLLSRAPLGGFTADVDLRGGVLSFETALSEERGRMAGYIALRPPYLWKTEATVNLSGIDPFLVLGKDDLTARSQLVANGDLDLGGQGMDVSRLNGSLRVRHLSLSMGDYRIANDKEARFRISGGKLALRSVSFSGPETRFSVSGGAKILKEVDLTFEGSADISLLKLLYKEIEYGSGDADVALSITNDWSNPEVSGKLRISNGEVKIRDIPQRFTALNGTIEFDRERITAEAIRGEVGGGKLSASGRAQLAGLALQDFSTAMSFENVTVRYPEGLASTLSGELAYEGDAAEQTLSGDVAIIRARYDKHVEWKGMLVDMGRSFYQKKKTDVGWIGNTQINIRFHGKDSITLQNNLAKMPLDLDVLLRGTVNEPQLVGRVEARKGVVYFRKNDFKILHGAVDFVDPSRLNPTLDIQAETRVREYQIRLALSGTAERSTLSFISDPPLSDVDILSLLALGKTGPELAGKESGVGMSEAASFATGQFQDIFERRARSLTGLDRFQVDPYVSKSNETSVPRVTVGKEIIQNKLYVTVSSNVGATMPEQVFRIEYILDKHLSLLGERNEIGNIGADVKFRFEFK